MAADECGESVGQPTRIFPRAWLGTFCRADSLLGKIFLNCSTIHFSYLFPGRKHCAYARLSHMFSVIELARRVLLFLRRKNLDSGFYAACAGLRAQSQALELIANSVANISTTG